MGMAEPVELTQDVSRWVQEIALYDKEAQGFEEAGKKILKRYKDKRGPRDTKNKFNVLWSNVQTLIPALYAKNPKVNIERRFQDDDDLGSKASEVLERCTSYFIEDDKFFDVMRQGVIDLLLPGRGTAWVRYVPHFKDQAVTGPQEVEDEGSEVTDDIPQELDYEEVSTDYVHWQDFGHSWARTWGECSAVWRMVYMTREELVARFPDCGEKITLDYSPAKLNDEKLSEVQKKATIYEIWDKASKKALWLHKEYPEFLDVRDDPLKLENFFPCPKPLYATLANDSLIPVADYTEYKDQAKELDDLTGRIVSITKALKVAGVYDSSAEGVQRLLAEGVENQLIPVTQWAMFAQKGGLDGAVSFMPMKDIAETLLSLYEARDKTKQDLYEISGIADILRGAGDPNETATASNIKSKFATLRLDARQTDVQRFAKDLVSIVGQIIATHFSLETIQQISGIKLLTKQQKDMIQQAMAQKQQQWQQLSQQAQATGQQPPPPPPEPPDDIQELLDAPTWEDVYQLLTNDELRCFRIDIETDSTIKTDQDAERDQKTALITSIGTFMEQSAQMPPEMQPLLMEMLIFAMNGYKIGKDLEGAFKIAQKKLQKAADNPTPPPDPEVQKAQMQDQLERDKMQAEQQQNQDEAQREMAKQQAEQDLEDKKIQADIQMNRDKLNNEVQIKALDMDHQKLVEAAKLRSSERIAKLGQSQDQAAETEITDPSLGPEEETRLGAMDAKIGHMHQEHQQSTAMLANHINEVAKSLMHLHAGVQKLSAPRKTKVIRDAQGKISGAISE